MPLEGHYHRVNTPLRKLTQRERNVVVTGLATTIVAIAAIMLFTAGDKQPPPPPGCISVSIAGRTGAELINGCGMEAREICAEAALREDPSSKAIVASCSDRGIRPLALPASASSS
jgi:hypothetical protein